MRLKVNEAIAQSEANGKKVLKQEIAKKLFSGATRKHVKFMQRKDAKN